jgi:hypothetical protein
MAFEGVATATFILMGFVVGLRLLLLAHRTRQLPETALGCGLFLIVGIAYPLYLVAIAAPGLSLATARLLAALSVVCMNPGWLAICVFTWRVFRPDAGWARIVVACVGVLLGAIVVARLAELWSMSDRLYLVQNSPALLSIQATAVAMYVWTGVEALLCHRRLRRQLALGLIEPVVVNRVALWACIAGFGLLTVAPACIAGLVGQRMDQIILIRLVSALAGLAVGGLLYLAFFPPRFYLRHVAGGATA